jgi:hypothetical protein
LKRFDIEARLTIFGHPLRVDHTHTLLQLSTAGCSNQCASLDVCDEVEICHSSTFEDVDRIRRGNFNRL